MARSFVPLMFCALSFYYQSDRWIFNFLGSGRCWENYTVMFFNWIMPIILCLNGFCQQLWKVLKLNKTWLKDVSTYTGNFLDAIRYYETSENVSQKGVAELSWLRTVDIYIDDDKYVQISPFFRKEKNIWNKEYRKDKAKNLDISMEIPPIFAVLCSI